MGRPDDKAVPDRVSTHNVKASTHIDKGWLMKVHPRVQALIDMVRSVFGAFFGSDLSYYPRRKGTGKKIESKEMLAEVLASLDSFQFEANELSKLPDPKLLLDRAKDSLEEVKKQTEYQDAKAGRLLTIVAFLTAAVGTVFGKFIDLYPLRSVPPIETSPWVTTTYLLFGIYLLLVAAGALVMFHGMSTRFVWPPGGSRLADKDEIVSLLFFQPIIRTTPDAWGKAFAGDRVELLRTYYKNYASEAYLIAAKVADKLRYLDPGQRLLNLSIRVLLCLFLLIILTFTFVAPPPKAATPVTSGATAPVTHPPSAPPAVGGSTGAAPLTSDKAVAANQSPAAASPAATVAASAGAPKVVAPAVPQKK